MGSSGTHELGAGSMQFGLRWNSSGHFGDRGCGLGKRRMGKVGMDFRERCSLRASHHRVLRNSKATSERQSVPGVRRINAVPHGSTYLTLSRKRSGTNRSSALSEAITCWQVLLMKTWYTCSLAAKPSALPKLARQRLNCAHSPHRMLSQDTSDA